MTIEGTCNDFIDYQSAYCSIQNLFSRRHCRHRSSRYKTSFMEIIVCVRAQIIITKTGIYLIWYIIDGSSICLVIDIQIIIIFGLRPKVR